MEWVKFEEGKQRVPIKSWCKDLEEGAFEQALCLSNHPVMFRQIVLCPDAHQGYGMPIGGVVACNNSVIPHAVGVDIGCGVGTIQTTHPSNEITTEQIKLIMGQLREAIPTGFSVYSEKQEWEGFIEYICATSTMTSDVQSGWYNKDVWKRAQKSLGTLGGGNHFLEIQKGDDGKVWLMLHSGSRNLGKVVADYYHKLALALNEKFHSALPTPKNKDDLLPFLPVDTREGQGYLRDMNFCMEFAKENRARMMSRFKEITQSVLKCEFTQEINIHHNYANLESHFGKNVWIHRKGATSAKKGELGIIPGSMGTSSYIVEGLGNRESFMSCSHGAGRKMGRMQACRTLMESECNKAMEGIVFGRWNHLRGRGKKKSQKMLDLGEAPQAYKDIDLVIEQELDLIKPLVKLSPLGVVKG